MEALLHIVCPQCQRTTRVPHLRLAEHPRCGACGEPLFDGEPVVLTDRNFHEHLRHTDLPVVVEFWAPSSTPAQGLHASFQQAARLLEPGARFGSVDVEAEREVVLRHAIHALPTVVVFRHGGEVARRSGNIPLPALVEWLRLHAHAVPRGMPTSLRG